MDGDRIELATQRIESALARIAAVAERDAAGNSEASALAAQHDALRTAVATQLAEIDALIREIEG